MAVMPKQNGLDILRKLVPLNTLSEETLAELMDSLVFEKIAKGEFLFHEGDTNLERIYLLSGKLGLIEGGKEVDEVAAHHNTARYPIAHHVPRKFSVKAKTKAEVVRIDSNLLSDLLSRGGGGIYQVKEVNAEADDDWMGQLLQSPIFQRIPAANIQNIMMRMEEVQVSDGEIIIRQGDSGDFFYLINQGQCAITRESETGELEDIARLGSGECFGEESLLSGNPRSSTVSMLTDGVLFRLPKAEFVEYIKRPLANAISYEEALSRVEQGAVWLDVRSQLEHERAHIPQSLNIPFSELRERGPKLEERAYIVYCQDGLVSSTAVYLLMEQGYDAYVLERGMESVPVADIEPKEPLQDSAQVINLRPEQESADSPPAPNDRSMPDDEAGLLRERLQKTEAQAQEQLQRARKMKQMLDKLKERLAETEQDGQRAIDENRRLNEEVSRLREQLEPMVTLEGRLAEAEQEGRRVVEDNRQLADELARLHEQLAAQEEQRATLAQQQATAADKQSEILEEWDQLREELAARSRQVTTLEEQLEQRQQAQAQTESALDQERTELARVLAETQAARTTLQGESEALQAALDEARAELATLAEQQATALSKQSEVGEERDHLQEELAARSRQITTLEEQLEAQQQVQAQAKSAFDRELTELTQSLAETQAARATLQGESETLQAALDKSGAELAALNEQLQQQERAAKEQQQALEASREETTRQEAEQRAVIAEITEQSLAQAAALEQASQRIGELESALAAHDSSQDERTEQLIALEKQHSLLNTERDQLKRELESAKEQVTRLESERSELERQRKREGKEQESAHQKRLDEVLSERDQAQTALRLANDERDRIAAELAVLQSNFKQLQQTIEERDQSLLELQHQRQRDEGESAGQNAVVEGLEAELGQLREIQAQTRKELQTLRAEAEERQRSLATLQQTLENEREKERQNEQGESEIAQRLELLTGEQAQLGDELKLLAETKAQLELQLEQANDQRAELKMQLEEEQQRQQQMESELEQLKSELARANSARGEVENTKAMVAELETLNTALDEADSAYEQLTRENQRLQAALDSSGVSDADPSELRALAEQKAAADQEIARLQETISLLQQEGPEPLEPEESDKSLRQELKLARERAEEEMVQLRQQLDAAARSADDVGKQAASDELQALRAALDEARRTLKELELSSSADAAENELLRQDLDKLKRSLEERGHELEKTRKESLLLEENTEERNSEIDRLKLALEAAQVDADEAQFKRDEALDARKQVEEALYQLQKQLERERPRDDLLEKRGIAASGVLDIDAIHATRPGLKGLLLGAVLAFAVAEGLALIGGKGELISGLFATSAEGVVESDKPVSAPIDQPPESPPRSSQPTEEETAPKASDPGQRPPVPTVDANPRIDQPAEPVASAVQPDMLTEPQAPFTRRAPVLSAPPLADRLSDAPAVIPEPPKAPAVGRRIQDRLSSGGRGPELVEIPAGRFEMGNNLNVLSREEQPAHQVTLSSFSIGRYEVTFREYGLFAAATGRRLPDDLGWGQGSRPVINVSWNDAVAYTEWLSQQTGQRYRLPTEAEWEYAAAAGSDTPYWWGFDLGSGRANCFNCGSQWDAVSTAPVGRFEANPFGLHNTAGNVMEWVADCYHDSYAQAPADGSAWLEPGCGERVSRGGAFNKPGESMRVTKRNRHSQDAALYVLGFRVVRELN